MKNKIIALCLLTVIILSALTACQKNQQYKAYSYSYFDTFSTVMGYEKSREKFDEVSDYIFDLLDEYHKLFDIYNEYDGINNLCTVNKLTDGEHSVVKVEEKIIDMLLFAKEMHALTDGRVNVAMGSVLSIWHDYRTAGVNNPTEAKLPSMTELTEASAHTDINDMIIDKEAGTVYLRNPKMTLDVGAVAKGYAVEMIAQELERRGVSGYALNIGGNIRVIGPKADGSPWKTGIENPTEDLENPCIAYLGVTNEAVVTSGSYQRYYTVNGKKYHHIIDRDTLMPAEGLLSVSVVCDNSGLGDALSTALFCMSLDDGMAFVNSLEGVEAIWVTEDNVIHYSENFKDYEI